MTGRRRFIAGTGLLLAFAAFPAQAGEGTQMYGLIGKFRAKPGEGDALIAILTGDVGAMPGCLSYIVAKDQSDPDLIWVTEVWDSRESHAASLSIPAVRDAIAKAMPLIAGMDSVAETRPVGGVGL